MTRSADGFRSPSPQSGTTTTTDYLYDGVNRMEDVDVNGSLLARYVQSTSVDEPLEEIASGTTSYYQQDGLGSVTSLSSTSGTIGNNTYTYDSYGNTTTSATVVNPFRYTGREFDSETGLFFSRARHYDPKVGRFLSEDPIGILGSGSNFYAYGNDPINLVDPLGLTNCVVTATMGVVCSDWNTNWSWLEPKGPLPPGLPPELVPNPSKPPKPPRNCNCGSSPRYWLQVFQIHQKYEERELRIVKESIGFGVGAGAGEHWLPWLDYLHLPELIYAEYEIREILREEDREIEELREQSGCK